MNHCNPMLLLSLTLSLSPHLHQFSISPYFRMVAPRCWIFIGIAGICVGVFVFYFHFYGCLFTSAKLPSFRIEFLCIIIGYHDKQQFNNLVNLSCASTKISPHHCRLSTSFNFPQFSIISYFFNSFFIDDLESFYWTTSGFFFTPVTFLLLLLSFCRLLLLFFLFCWAEEKVKVACQILTMMVWRMGMGVGQRTIVISRRSRVSVIHFDWRNIKRWRSPWS